MPMPSQADPRHSSGLQPSSNQRPPMPPGYNNAPNKPICGPPNMNPPSMTSSSAPLPASNLQNSYQGPQNAMHRPPGPPFSMSGPPASMQGPPGLPNSMQGQPGPNIPQSSMNGYMLNPPAAGAAPRPMQGPPPGMQGSMSNQNVMAPSPQGVHQQPPGMMPPSAMHQQTGAPEGAYPPMGNQPHYPQPAADMQNRQPIHHPGMPPQPQPARRLDPDQMPSPVSSLEKYLISRSLHSM